MAVDKFPVELGHIMMFARSVGDPNPIYYDEDYAKGTEVGVGSSRVDLQACKLEYSIVSPK